MTLYKKEFNLSLCISVKQTPGLKRQIKSSNLSFLEENIMKKTFLQYFFFLTTYIEIVFAQKWTLHFKDENILSDVLQVLPSTSVGQEYQLLSL